MWKNTAEIRQAAANVYSKLIRGEIDADAAKAMGAQLRTAIKSVALELDAHKLSGAAFPKTGKLKTLKFD